MCALSRRGPSLALPPLGSLASLGGIWNGDAVPSSRTTLFAVVAAVVLLGVVAAGLPVVIRKPTAIPLLVLAAAAVVIPALMATVPGLAAVESMVRAMPGLGVVRDAQKWVALAVPGYTLAAAGAVLTLRRWVPAFAAAAVCSLALIATLPDLAWGVGGKVVAVEYPAGWAAAAATINADPRAGRGAADGQHAELRLGGRCAGARPAAALGARRCADDRRPDDLGARGTR